MPKLLDVIKQAGLTHEQVIELIKEKTDKPIDESEIETPSEPEAEETDKPESTGAVEEVEDVSPDLEELGETREEEEEEEKPDVKELVKKEVQKQLKVKRRTPSKGKVSDRPTIDRASIKKNWYEEIV